MKSIVLALVSVSFILAFNSCKKDSPHNPVKGQWRWTLSTGGFSGSSILEPSPDSIVALTFDGSLTYATYLNNQTKVRGKYQIITISGSTSIHFDKSVSTDNLYLRAEQTIFLNRNDSLGLSDNMPDGFVHFFIRIQ